MSVLHAAMLGNFAEAKTTRRNEISCESKIIRLEIIIFLHIASHRLNLDAIDRILNLDEFFNAERDVLTLIACLSFLLMKNI